VNPSGRSRFRGIAWYLRRHARRGRSILFAPIFWDRHRSLSRAVAVVGSARSGTTWLGDLLAAGFKARIMFEPFHPVHVPEAARFGLMPYRRPDDEDPQFLEFCRSVFSGELRGPWVDRQASRILPAGRVVKCVRANLFAAWLKARLSDLQVVVLVRHPMAVVLSRMGVGWDPAMDVEALLGNERLVRDHLRADFEWARSLRTEEERNALVWGIHHLVTFRQRHPLAGSEVVFYEDLLADPAAVLTDLYDRLGRPSARTPERRLRRPSSTARTPRAAKEGDIRGVSRGLGAERAARVRAVVERLGLDWVYGSGSGPTELARGRLGRGGGPPPLEWHARRTSA